MAFSAYKTIGNVMKEFQISSEQIPFVEEIKYPAPDGFKAEIDFMRREGAIENSEFAICENFIYPILKDIWKNYYKKFVLWSHEPLNYDEKLSGIPDYTLAKRSRLGSVVFDQPYLLVVEAKQDDFTAGWAQCLAEMIAVQKMNVNPEQVIFGIVTNGRIWEFGKLEIGKFTLHPDFYSIGDIDRLFAAVNFIFQQCEAQLNQVMSLTQA